MVVESFELAMNSVEPSDRVVEDASLGKSSFSLRTPRCGRQGKILSVDFTKTIGTRNTRRKIHD